MYVDSNLENVPTLDKRDLKQILEIQLKFWHSDF